MRIEKNSLARSGLVVPFILLFVWWYGTGHSWWSSFLLPSPSLIASVFVSSLRDGTLQLHVFASLSRIVKGFGISSFLALSSALLCAWFPLLLDQLRPLLNFLRYIPPMSVIPILILWFGIGEAPKIILIILATFFPVFMSALQGINGCDKNLIEVGKVFRYTRWQIFKFIILPAALPAILTGLRLGLGYSWRSLVAVELIAASSGLGYMIIDAEQLSRSDVVIMGILVIGALGAFLDYIFIIVIKYYFRRVMRFESA